MNRDNLIISFSGGRTSAYMTKMLLDANDYENIHVVFANTGQEHEKTLEFVHNCDTKMGFNSTWIEASVNPEKGMGTRHSIVSYETASRNGEPFEDVIRKYGMPFSKAPICTRELKLNPIMSYVQSLGLQKSQYHMAIGIRADEIDRMSATARQESIIYPLVGKNIKKRDILEWWRCQNFDLEIPEHFGNCVWCWKKSFRKLSTVMREDPSAFDFPRRMEREYPRHGSFANKTGSEVRFFRGRKTVDDIEIMMEDGHDTFKDEWFEATNGCSDSCEVFTDDNQFEMDFDAC